MNLDDLKEHGGPAFPVHRMEWDFNNPVMATKHPGMTLRDYFASKAMQGMLADSAFDAIAENLAQAAYIIADAMLAARGAQ